MWVRIFGYNGVDMILLVIGILLFIGLVVVHEWGHFIMARRSGVTVEEFGIFFPPRLWSRQTKGGWRFSINALPLGGFVRLKGEHDTDTARGSFGAASLSNKSRIMAAGVVMNLLTALALLTVLAWLGMPKLVNNQFTVKSDTKVIKREVIISAIEPGSPAQKAGLQPSDRLLKLGPPGNEQKLSSAADLPRVTRHYAGQTVDVSYARGGQVRHTVLTLRSLNDVAASQHTPNPKGYMGVYPVEYSLQRSTWSAPVVAAGLSAQFTALTFQGLGRALAGVGGLVAGSLTGNTTARQHGQTEATSQVSGPVGIFMILKDGSAMGYQFMLMIIAVISLTLAIMNILPIPALDGGRLWLTLVARGLFKKPLPPKREELINGIGFAFLMLLVILITFVDVHRFL